MDTPKKICNNFPLSLILCLQYSSLSDAICALPEDLKNTVWEYNYTDVVSNLEQSTNLYISNTTLPDSVINLNAEGTIVNNWTCINSLDISDTTNVVVFKSDTSFPNGGNRRLYLCMKLTQVTTDLFYFHLLSDIKNSIFPNERVFISEADNPQADNASICSTFCQYTQPMKIRTLRRQGSSSTLDINVSLCEPCDSACEEATTMMTSLETTKITKLPSTSTKMDITTDITSTESTRKTSKQSTSTEIGTTIDMISTETTHIHVTTLASTAIEIDTTTEMTTTAPKTKLQTISTPTQIESITELATTTKTTLSATSTEIDTTIQLTSTDTTQTTVVCSTVTDLKTTKQTITSSADTDRETTTKLRFTTIDVRDETTLETKSADSENLKQYSAPIILAVVVCPGFVFVVIVFVLLKYVKRPSMINTDETINLKTEEACGSFPKEIFIVYKGKNNVYKIAI